MPATPVLFISQHRWLFPYQILTSHIQTLLFAFQASVLPLQCKKNLCTDVFIPFSLNSGMLHQIFSYLFEKWVSLMPFFMGSNFMGRKDYKLRNTFYLTITEYLFTILVGFSCNVMFFSPLLYNHAHNLHYTLCQRTQCFPQVHSCPRHPALGFL